MTMDPAPAANGAAAVAGGGMKRQGGRWWYAAAGALIVALLAVAVSYYSFRGIPSSPPGGCGCPVRISPLVLPIAWLFFGDGGDLVDAVLTSEVSPCRCGPFQAARKYTGMVEDCCCDYETVDAINEEVLHPILQELVKLPFFRYFKVSTYGLFSFLNVRGCDFGTLVEMLLWYANGEIESIHA